MGIVETAAHAKTPRLLPSKTILPHCIEKKQLRVTIPIVESIAMCGSVPVLVWAQRHTDVSWIHASWVSAKPKLSAVRFKF